MQGRTQAHRCCAFWPELQGATPGQARTPLPSTPDPTWLMGAPCGPHVPFRSNFPGSPGGG